MSATQVAIYARVSSDQQTEAQTVASQVAALRERVPTSNFFQPGGYARNPIAVRSGVVSKLLAGTNAVMDQESKLPGAKELASLFPK